MQAPIGIFDSGLGGLTVLREIRRMLPKERLIYVGDTARVPYGVKSADTVTRYSREICDFLLNQGVKAIVVACNTASALALPQLREIYGLPLLGVLEPGARAAVQATRNRCIGVIGTEGTIRSQSYRRALGRLDARVQVVDRACPLFVPLVEEGWLNHEVTRRVAEIYLKDWQATGVDTLILGCTHYPLLKEVLQEVLGPQVQLVDSALETARVLQELLHGQGNLAANTEADPIHEYYSTDAPEKMQELAARFLGIPLIETVRLANLAE